jgi:hypothetical protein
MLLLDPARYLPAPDTLEEAAELAEDLIQAAEQAARLLASSLDARIKPRKGAQG